MADKRILKNVSGGSLQLLNRDIDDGQQYDIPAHLWLELIDDEPIQALVTSGDLIVNDGDEDLSANAGLLHLKQRMGKSHEPIQFSPPIGENAPEPIPLNGASCGFAFNEDEELYTFTHFDNPIDGEPIDIQLHMTIDNSDADRWVQFEFTWLTTTGSLDKAMNTHDDITPTAQIEVPTTPWLIFEVKTTLPAEYFENGEDNLFLKVKRITATGKTAPTNRPVIVKIDKIYKRIKVN